MLLDLTCGHNQNYGLQATRKELSPGEFSAAGFSSKEGINFLFRRIIPNEEVDFCLGVKLPITSVFKHLNHVHFTRYFASETMRTHGSF